jgi:hypothetical protein
MNKIEGTPKKVPTLSACFIAGNEAHCIGNILRDIRDHVDEVVIVKAVGNQMHDSTALVALDCIAEKKLHLAAYGNRDETLPHIDDFAAARNKSFSLAAGDWILWLDCDDRVTPENMARIREAIAIVPDDVNALFCSYAIADKGSVILRERLIRNGKGKWRGAIHETCVIEGKALECPQIVIHHTDPDPAKSEGSARRNLAILDRVLDQYPRHLFYRHAEHVRLGNVDAARADGLAALACLHKDNAEERYLVHLNLAELEPDRAEGHLAAAVQLQPHRREAFAMLVQYHTRRGQVSQATSYFRMLDALPVPAPLPWTHQACWYGKAWGRQYLRVRLLRAAGQRARAAGEHAANLLDPEYRAQTAALDLDQPPQDTNPN